MSHDRANVKKTDNQYSHLVSAAADSGKSVTLNLWQLTAGLWKGLASLSLSRATIVINKGRDGDDRH